MNSSLRKLEILAHCVIRSLKVVTFSVKQCMGSLEQAEEYLT